MFGKQKKLSNRSRNYQRQGHAKQKIFSYSSSRRGSERPLQRGINMESTESTDKKTSLLTKLQYTLTVILIILGIGYLFSLSSTSQVKVSGTQLLPREDVEYRQVIERELHASWLNRNKITIDKSNLALALKQEFPEIRFVDVKTSLLRHEPTVEIELARPVAQLITPVSAYVLDSQGYALFDTSVQKSDFDVTKLTPIKDRSGHKIEVGKPALTADQIVYVNEAMGQFERARVPIDEMILESGGLELHVRPKDKKYLIKFSFLADAKQSSGAYLLLREKNISANQYIDVRIPDRAYVK